MFFLFQAEDGIQGIGRSRGIREVYKGQGLDAPDNGQVIQRKDIQVA